MILIIDNYDSFTYNLVQYVGELGEKPVVYRNDAISPERIARLNPKKIIISPGPCTPKEAGVSTAVIKAFSGKKPILGVCLGHQCLGYVFGGEIVVAKRIMHGKTSPIYHKNKGITRGLKNPFDATRYHSLLVKRDTLPSCFEITAWTKEGEIMGLKHKKHPSWGVQFHPESIMTQGGKELLRNFLSL